MVMMTDEDAKNKGLTPLAKIVSSACTGVKPEIMGTGPISAIQTAVSIRLYSMGISLGTNYNTLNGFRNILHG